MTQELPSHLRPDLRGFGRAFWEGAKHGKLLLPSCVACASPSWPPRRRCPFCGAPMDWIQASGHGVVHTFTVIRQTAEPYFKPRVPYVVAMIELDEGPRMMSNVVGCAVDAVAVGMAVAVTFIEFDDGLSLPMFTPRTALA